MWHGGHEQGTSGLTVDADNFTHVDGWGVGRGFRCRGIGCARRGEDGEKVDRRRSPKQWPFSFFSGRGSESKKLNHGSGRWGGEKIGGVGNLDEQGVVVCPTGIC